MSFNATKLEDEPIKQCRDCLETRGVNDFTKDRGRITTLCKKCAVKRATKWAKNNSDRRKEYDRNYHKTDVGKIVRKIAKKRYRQTINGKKNHSLNAKKQTERYPEKVHARKLLNRAVNEGRVVPEPCEQCGKLKTHGHHKDYTKPLDVHWLCPQCHADHHLQQKS